MMVLSANGDLTIDQNNVDPVHRSFFSLVAQRSNVDARGAHVVLYQVGAYRQGT